MSLIFLKRVKSPHSKDQANAGAFDLWSLKYIQNNEQSSVYYSNQLQYQGQNNLGIDFDLALAASRTPDMTSDRVPKLRTRLLEERRAVLRPQHSSL